MNVLLVDDDPGVIVALLPALKSDADIDVRAATSGDKAIEHAESLGNIDLLITDVVMEPMDGFTLRDKLTQRFPKMRTIFITGYDLSDYPAQTKDHQVLIKPIGRDELFAAIGPTSKPEPKTEPPIAPIPRPALMPAPKPAPGTPIAPRRAALPTHVAAPAPAAVSAPAPKVAAPVPVPAPPTVPKATPAPAAVPVAAPRATAPAPQAVPIKATAQATGDLSGQVLGLYKILRKLGDGQWGDVYHAVQTSMNRPVALKILSSELQQDQLAKERFIADAQAKAAAQHPFILTVYEAGSAGGRTYYTQEFVDGSTLADRIEQGQPVDEPTALRIIRTAVEGLAYFSQHHTPHRNLDASSLYLTKENRARLSNIATSRSDEAQSTQQEIQTLAQIVSKALPGGAASDPGLRALLARMNSAGPGGFLSWSALLQAVQAIEPKIVPLEAHKISKQDEEAIRAVEGAKKAQKRQLVCSIVGIFALLWLVAGAVWWTFFRGGEKNLDISVEIPAGEFTYGEGADKKQITLPIFWIDKYEVTLGQYAKFLAYLAKNPTTEFDHPKQPKGKSHVPPSWDIYYGRASSSLKKYRNVKYVPLDLNCPAFLVDWWDAYAYAKWKGRRLPTEQEWEKAGRGAKGLLYPWGDEWDPKKCNSSADFSQSPGPNYKPSADGYVWWAPVDEMQSDKSPYGVIDMAGNVSEWTDSWDATGKFPVIRGGSYHSPPKKLTDRVAELDPERSEEFIGFRTATSEPPKK